MLLAILCLITLPLVLAAPVWISASDEVIDQGQTCQEFCSEYQEGASCVDQCTHDGAGETCSNTEYNRGAKWTDYGNGWCDHDTCTGVNYDVMHENPDTYWHFYCCCDLELGEEYPQPPGALLVEREGMATETICPDGYGVCGKVESSVEVDIYCCPFNIDSERMHEVIAENDPESCPEHEVLCGISSDYENDNAVLHCCPFASENNAFITDTENYYSNPLDHNNWEVGESFYCDEGDVVCELDIVNENFNLNSCCPTEELSPGEACSDNEDNDVDELIDMEDPNCHNLPELPEDGSPWITSNRYLEEEGPGICPSNRGPFPTWSGEGFLYGALSGADGCCGDDLGDYSYIFSSKDYLCLNDAVNHNGIAVIGQPDEEVSGWNWWRASGLNNAFKIHTLR